MSISGIDNSGNNYDFYIREDHDLINASIKYGNNPYGIPALHYAIMQGDEKAVRLFLDHGASPDSVLFNWLSPEEPFTALEYAAKYGNLNIVQLLLERGAHLTPPTQCEHYNGFGMSLSEVNPLRFAAMSDNPELIQIFINRGCRIVDTDYLNPIQYAIRAGAVNSLKALLNLGSSLDIIKYPTVLVGSAANSGKFEMVKFLLDHGFSIDSMHNSALSVAIKNEDIKMVQLLINHGAKVDRPELSNESPWNLACQKENITIIQMLLKASPNNLDDKLLAAIETGKIDIVKALITAGADVNARRKFDRQPTVFSAIHHPKILQFLIDKKVNLTPPFDGGNTILHHAARQHCYEAIEILVKNGVLIDSRNTNGETPLHLTYDVKTTTTLLNLGANVNITSNGGGKPFYGRTNIVVLKAFIKAGANINEVSPGAWPLLHQAIWAANKELILFLINEIAVSIHQKEQNGRTPLLFAIERGDTDTVELLLKKGADINARDNQGQTALSIARKHHQELVEWLIARGAR